MEIFAGKKRGRMNQAHRPLHTTQCFYVKHDKQGQTHKLSPYTQVVVTNQSYSYFLCSEELDDK